MTLQEFIKEQEDALKAFEKFWISQNKKYPLNYPLEVDEDNAGLWFEMYLTFYDDDQL